MEYNIYCTFAQVLWSNLYLSTSIFCFFMIPLLYILEANIVLF